MTTLPAQADLDATDKALEASVSTLYTGATALLADNNAKATQLAAAAQAVVDLKGQVSTLKAQVATLQASNSVPLYTVSPGQSINAAFKANKVVSVQPGTYSEAVTVPAGSTLNAAGVTLDGKGTIPQLLVVGAGAVVNQVKVTGAKPPAGQIIGAILVNGSNAVLNGVESSDNFDTGIDIHGTQAAPVNNVTLNYCKALRNGRQGIKGGWITNSLIANCESGFNNTQKNSPGNEAGGGKFAQTVGLTFFNYNCHDAAGIGLWLDVHNKDADVIGGSFINNVDPTNSKNGSGIQIEISEGPVRIRRATFSGNTGSADVNVCESTGVDIEQCSFSTKGGGIWTRNMANRPPQLGPITQSGNTFANGAVHP